MKRLSRADAIAIKLRGLRVQQQRQRIIRGMTPRDVGMQARGGGIAMADREQSLRDRMPAAGMTPFAAMALETFWQPPERKQYRPGQNRRDNNNADQDRKSVV